jgi:hypothetical protein
MSDKPHPSKKVLYCVRRFDELTQEEQDDFFLRVRTKDREFQSVRKITERAFSMFEDLRALYSELVSQNRTGRQDYPMRDALIGRLKKEGHSTKEIIKALRKASNEGKLGDENADDCTEDTVKAVLKRSKKKKKKDSDDGSRAVGEQIMLPILTPDESAKAALIFTGLQLAKEEDYERFTNLVATRRIELPLARLLAPKSSYPNPDRQAEASRFSAALEEANDDDLKLLANQLASWNAGDSFPNKIEFDALINRLIALASDLKHDRRKEEEAPTPASPSSTSTRQQSAQGAKKARPPKMV